MGNAVYVNDSAYGVLDFSYNYLEFACCRSKFGSHSMQLTATRQTKFLPVNVNENLLDLVYEPREVGVIYQGLDPMLCELREVGVIDQGV